MKSMNILTLFRKIQFAAGNIFRNALRSALLIIGIGIIGYTVFRGALHPIVTIRTAIGSCLGMFLICLSYGMGYFDIKGTNYRKNPALKDAEEKFQQRLNAKIIELEHSVKIDGLKQRLKERQKKLQKTLNELQEKEFEIKEKSMEIQRLQSMNNTIEAIYHRFELVLFYAQIRKIDHQKYYVDESGNQVDIEIPQITTDMNNGVIGAIKGVFDRKRVYEEYLGITDWHYGVEGKVDLSQVRIWEEHNALCFTGIHSQNPLPIDSKPNQLIAQRRRVTLKREDKKLRREKVELINDDDANGQRNQQDTFRRHNDYSFDETTQDYIETSAVNFIKLLLAPFGKKTDYRPCADGTQQQPLLDFFIGQIQEKEKERAKLDKEYHEKKEEYTIELHKDIMGEEDIVDKNVR